MSREHLPYMSDEHFHSVAFVYRSKTDGIRVVGLNEAKNFSDRNKYKHLATLDSFRWIECLLNLPARKRGQAIRNTLEQP